MVKFEQVCLSFENRPLIHNLSFHLPPGGKAVLKGESGSGKTTLIKALLGFQPIDSGKITIDGIPQQNGSEKQIRSRTAWLPQEISGTAETAEEFLLHPFQFKSNRHLSPSNAAISEILEAFRLKQDILQKELKHISGGEKQRLGLASILLLKKKLIILDEPTSALDLQTRNSVTDYILQNKELTLLASSHDEYWIAQSDLIITLNTTS